MFAYSFLLSREFLGSCDLQGPLLVMDGAHTRESAASLVASVRDAFPAATHPLVLVVAMAEDKDARQVGKYLCAVTHCAMQF